MAAGRAVTPEEEAAAARLHHYWVAGEGRKKWLTSPHPWQALHDELAKYIHNPELLDKTTSKWHNELLPATGGRCLPPRARRQDPWKQDRPRLMGNQPIEGAPQ